MWGGGCTGSAWREEEGREQADADLHCVVPLLVSLRTSHNAAHAQQAHRTTKITGTK